MADRAVSRPEAPAGTPRQQMVLFAAGGALLLPLLATWRLNDLRAATPQFLALYMAAFAVYAVATVAALRLGGLSGRALAGLFLLAGVMMAVTLINRPTLSDDMYRYVWEGRVQASGFSPYRFPPNAPELSYLQDGAIWKYINRKGDVTVYPPIAQAVFLLLWRIAPDSVRWFQAAMALSALLAGGLLVGLLRDLGRSPARVIIYLWAPLLIFETAHSAHMDALVLPLLVGAWWARTRSKDVLVGVLLGLATAAKLYPALLLPALWRPDDRRGRWTMPLAFALTLAASYIPSLLSHGSEVLGFLPKYFGERFNMGLAGLVIPLFKDIGVEPNRALLALMLATLGGITLWMVARPAPDGETAVRRSIWLIGAYTLLTQNLFSWYMLWMLPLVAIFLPSLPATTGLAGIQPALRRPGSLAWTGWWLFCGLIGLSYSFFIVWRPAPWALWAQYLPLYLLLAGEATRWLLARRQLTAARAT
ncbi:MAG: glycosyltransferase 87 family protein [Caldilineales bacterium]